MNSLVQIYIILGIDAIGAFLIFVALLTRKLDDFSFKYRIAIALVGIGFLGQLAMLSQLLATGALEYSYFTRVYWLIKDVGVVLWFASAFYDIQFKNLYLRVCKRREDTSVRH